MKSALIICSVFLLFLHHPVRAQWNWDPAINTTISADKLNRPIMKDVGDSLIFFHLENSNMSINRTSFSKEGVVGSMKSIAPMHAENGQLIDADSVIINTYINADSLIIESFGLNGHLISSSAPIPIMKFWNFNYSGEGVYVSHNKQTVLAFEGTGVGPVGENVINYVLVFDSVFQKVDSLYVNGYHSLGYTWAGDLTNFKSFGLQIVFNYEVTTSQSGYCKRVGVLDFLSDTAIAPVGFCPDFSHSFHVYDISGNRLAIKRDLSNCSVSVFEKNTYLHPGPIYSENVTNFSCGKGVFPMFLSFPNEDHLLQFHSPYKVRVIDSNNVVAYHQMWGDTTGVISRTFRIKDCDRQFMLRPEGQGNHYLIEYLPATKELINLGPIILNTSGDYRYDWKLDDFEWNGEWYKLIHWNEDISSKRVGVGLNCLGQTLNLNPLSVNNIKVFPNPAHSEIRVTTDRLLKFELKNILGELIEKGIIQVDSKIDLSHLSTGTYFLQWQDPNGNSGVEKIMKL